MDKLLHLVRRSRIFPILAAGGAGFIFQISIFELLAVYLQLTSASIATVIGAEVGIFVNFFINDRVSFRHRPHKLPLIHRLLRHQGVVLGAVFVQWLFVFSAENLTDDLLYIRLALLAGIAVGFVWNYALYHLFVWKHHHPPVQ